MSRWSAEPLRIGLAPGEVALVRGAKRQCWPAGRTATSLLPVLETALAEPDWFTPRVDVVLSQHFVRHVLTPAPGKALSAAEEIALARASLQEVYGEQAAGWRVRVHSQPPQHGVFGAAIDGEFARALDDLLARRGFSRIRVRPLAAIAIERLPARTSGWWVLAEPGWLMLFGGADGRWQHLAALPAGADWPDTLAHWLAHEIDSSECGLPPAAWLQGAGVGRVATPHDTRLRWQVLPHDSQTAGATALLTI